MTSRSKVNLRGPAGAVPVLRSPSPQRGGARGVAVSLRGGRHRGFLRRRLARSYQDLEIPRELHDRLFPVLFRLPDMRAHPSERVAGMAGRGPLSVTAAQSSQRPQVPSSSRAPQPCGRFPTGRPMTTTELTGSPFGRSMRSSEQPTKAPTGLGLQPEHQLAPHLAATTATSPRSRTWA